MKITVVGVIIFTFMFVSSSCYEGNKSAKKQLEDTNNLKLHCVRYLRQPLTNVCSRKYNILDKILILGRMLKAVFGNQKIVDICCPRPCTVNYLKENYCNYGRFTRSANVKHTPPTTPVSSTTTKIITTSMITIINSTKKNDISTEKPWWKKFLTHFKIPGYQSYPVGSHWVHTHS